MNIKEAIITINQMQADGVIDQYAIGGAVAATFYLEPVDTIDVDVFIHLNPLPGQSLISLDPVHNYLRGRGGRIDARGYTFISEWLVQFLVPDNPLVEEALQQAVEKDVDGVPVRVFTAEHLAAIALQLGRPKDKLRLIQLLEARALDEAIFRLILERHNLFDRWVRFKRQYTG